MSCTFVSALKRCAQLAADCSGSGVIVAAIVAPVLLLAVGAALDYGRATSAKTSLQEMADAAAIASARELALANADTAHLQSVAEQSVAANFGNLSRGGITKPVVAATANTQEGTVAVKITATQANVFGGFLQPPSIKLSTSAVAQAMGGTKLCVLGLDPSANGAIKLKNNAKMTAKGCAVYSNSSHKHAIKSFHSSSIEAELICSVGGNDGQKGSFDPDPITDCPAVPDPLASRPGPAFGSCDETDLVLNNQTRTLDPGVYCGGLTIKGTSNVTFESGIYIMSDGPLEIEGSSTIEGEYTGFYFTGSGAELTIGRDTTVELSAPRDGEMAGLLFFQDAATADKKSQFRVLSNDARILLGTIYLPKAEFYVDATEPIADHSAYTVIIANKFQLSDGPDLVLNTDYASTDVPVPNGVLNKNANITLIK
ncbi:MAG: pilus assembly protein [Alphaproteobacteria bacterium]|nr:pilus assembly protein [Alphaproteobacteria bacterium]